MIDQDGIKITTKLLDKKNKILVINLGGYIDQANVDLLQQTINDALNNGNYKLIFDLKNLAYMSSAGWGVMVGEIKRFRENGGDIKLVNMGPEIYEIYQMLEFYHIISEYTTIEKALESFSGLGEVNVKGKPRIIGEVNPVILKKGLKETERSLDDDKIIVNNQAEIKDRKVDENPQGEKSIQKKEEFIENEVDLNLNELTEKEIDASVGMAGQPSYIEFSLPVDEKPVDLKELPVTEKIKQIISDYPQFGPNKIKKILRHPEYGSVKIGYFKVRAYLKELDLDTIEKRIRFYRST